MRRSLPKRRHPALKHPYLQEAAAAELKEELRRTVQPEKQTFHTDEEGDPYSANTCQLRPRLRPTQPKTRKMNPRPVNGRSIMVIEPIRTPPLPV